MRFSRMTLKITAGVMAAALLAGAGCKKEAGNEGGFTIVASFYPVYIIARNIADGVEGVRVVDMTPPVTGCLHDYSVTAEDMKNLEGAGIFLINGAGMESFMGQISGRYPDLRIAELSRGIKLISEGGEENPHVWVSVTNAITMTRNCADALAAADNPHADMYRANAEKYIAKLTGLKNEMDSRLKQFRGRKIVTFHEAFPYFAREYGLVIAAVIEREPGSEPSAKDLAETVKLVKKSGIKALFTEPQYPAAAAETIASETGAKVYVLDPAVTGPDSNDAYIDIMRKNLEVLETAFK